MWCCVLVHIVSNGILSSCALLSFLWVVLVRTGVVANLSFGPYIVLCIKFYFGGRLNKVNVLFPYFSQGIILIYILFLIYFRY